MGINPVNCCHQSQVSNMLGHLLGSNLSCPFLAHAPYALITASEDTVAWDSFLLQVYGICPIISGHPVSMDFALPGSFFQEPMPTRLYPTSPSVNLSTPGFHIKTNFSYLPATHKIWGHGHECRGEEGWGRRGEAFIEAMMEIEGSKYIIRLGKNIYSVFSGFHLDLFVSE